MTTTTDSIHGHDLIHYVAEHQPTESALIAHFMAQYGDTLRFHTCSQQNITIEELLTFLKKRKKIVEHGGVLQVNAERLCQH
ncbi:hypothetical protein VST7929_02649 [Vibrio stylophorae]|uniref:Metal-binding protein n=1 Tax=Vibrio stylophorae TaxID=659351 RepID=A0ABN8DUI8_9VIBR|nr:YecH family metal-binding protein [Vibrio stylophorae]CAH0534699.1 hypothetical protein VST7929_02649 [Vibrio stylophorae]